MGASSLDSSKQMTDQLAQYLRPRHRRAMFGIFVLMGLLILLHFSTFQTEVVRSDLLDGEPCRPSQTQEIVRSLNIEGLTDFELIDGKIMVPSSLKASYYSALEKHGIPGFGVRQDDMVKSNFLLAPSERERMAKLRKRREVMDMIVRLPYVDEVWLECDSSSQGIFEPAKMSAVVMVQPRADLILSWDNILTIRETIAPAFAGLAAEDIVVTDLNEGRAHPEDSLKGNVHAQSVRWRVDRQRYYIQKIERILAEYPGIEIDVYVENLAERPGSDQLTADDREFPLAKGLAAPISSTSLVPARDLNTLKLRSGSDSVPGANGVAVLCPDSPVVEQVDYVKNVDFVELDKLKEDVETVAESVHVIIRVPSQLLASMPCPTDMANVKVDSPDSKFKLIKDDIVKRINPILPQATGQNELPVAVILEGQTSHDTTVAENWLWLKNIAIRHWPLVAVGFLGFITVFFHLMRAPGSHRSEEMTSQPGYSESSGDELKAKLASLIDQDPETAAKVIKSWLRDVA